ncbi:antigen WC1.1-like [Arapaima gigas]
MGKSSEHTTTTGIPETPRTTTIVKPGPQGSPTLPGLSVPAVVFLVLGAFLFLLLVLLAAQLYQNRVLKRGTEGHC